jgi:hypothetical protein
VGSNPTSSNSFARVTQGSEWRSYDKTLIFTPHSCESLDAVVFFVQNAALAVAIASRSRFRWSAPFICIITSTTSPPHDLFGSAKKLKSSLENGTSCHFLLRSYEISYRSLLLECCVSPKSLIVLVMLSCLVRFPAPSHFNLAG